MAQWQLRALVAGSAIAAIGAAIMPGRDDGDAWTYQTLVDHRGRFVAGVLLTSAALLVLVAGIRLLSRYAISRGRAAVNAGLGILAAGTALLALGIASQMSLAIAARGELYAEPARRSSTWRRTTVPGRRTRTWPRDSSSASPGGRPSSSALAGHAQSARWH